MSICEIVLPGQSVRLPSDSECVSVMCPECGSSWTTTERHSRRIAAGEFPATCKPCKRPGHEVKEVHRRYWLLLYGCELDGRDSTQYVLDEGLPPELAEICDGLDCLLGIAA